MALHHSIARSENGRVHLVEEAGPGPVTEEEAVFQRASVVLMCASYRNQALHVFTRPALVAVAMTTAPSYNKGECKLCYDDVIWNNAQSVLKKSRNFCTRVLKTLETGRVCTQVSLISLSLQTTSLAASVFCKMFWQMSLSSCQSMRRR